MTPEPDHHELLLRMHRGHEPSAQRLWALLAPRLIGYARATLPSELHADAEDVVQSVFLTALSHPRRELRGVRDVTAWMFRLTRNAAHNHARTERREHDRRSARDAPHTPTDRPDLEHDPGGLRLAAAHLSEPHRDVLLLRHVGGLTLAQCAELLELPKSTVAGQEQAALHDLRTRLGPDLTLKETR